VASNEHPDMSGNPCDTPFICEMCEKEVREEDIYGSKYNQDVVLCSNQCACDYDESQESKFYD
jgi:hypothetical protein